MIIRDLGVPAHDRCNLLSVVATTIGLLDTLSVQMICRCGSMPLRRTAASSRMREKSPLVATGAIRWCQLARSISAQFQVTTVCQWRLARSGTLVRSVRRRRQRSAGTTLYAQHAVGTSTSADLIMAMQLGRAKRHEVLSTPSWTGFRGQSVP
jgi:hypothetical protein